MTCCAGPLVGDMAHDAVHSIDMQRVTEFEAGARHLADGTVAYALSVPAIHCGQCIFTIEKSLSAVEGVKAVRANLAMRRVAVTLEDQSQSPEGFIRRLEELGYAAQTLDEELDGGQGAAELNMLLRCLAVSGFAAANIMLLSVSVWSGAEAATRDLFHFISALIAIPTVAHAGRPFFRSAIAALRNGRMNMDVPISLGVSLATLMSLYESYQGGSHAYFDAAVSLLFFLLIGRTLDQVMRAKARDAVGRLSRLAAKGGLIVLPNGELNYLALDAIRPGMILRVAAGERIPVDGTVTEGTSDVDRALVTGESAPLHVAKGMVLEAGTMNLTGALDIKAERDAKNSFLAEVMQMMQAAEKGRGTYVRLADRMAKIYSPAVHILAVATFMGWMIATSGNWHTSLTTAISVLIITCPCALGLAVPVAHVLAASKLFENGILMKDGSALERLAEIDTIVFDKTGTLTTNAPRVGKSTIPPGENAAIAKALAMRSVHPAARALANFLPERQAAKLHDLHEVPGLGVEAYVDGQRTRLGRMQWVAEIVATTPSNLPRGLGFAIEGQRLCHVELEETLREGASETVQAFANKNISSSIMSGDSAEAVAQIANACGIVAFQTGLKPGEKLEGLKSLAVEGHKTLMVGDGLNDAPALAAAHVSMAPASASDTGRVAADFVLTRNDLASAWQAHQIAKYAARIVKENFALAIIYNAVAVPLSMAGALNPFIAALAMSSSSILVVASSLRIKLMNVELAARTAPMASQKFEVGLAR